MVTSPLLPLWGLTRSLRRRSWRCICHKKKSVKLRWMLWWILAKFFNLSWAQIRVWLPSQHRRRKRSAPSPWPGNVGLLVRSGTLVKCSILEAGETPKGTIAVVFNSSQARVRQVACLFLGNVAHWTGARGQTASWVVWNDGYDQVPCSCILLNTASMSPVEGETW